MNKEYKKLYKKFAHYNDIDIIRNKIKEYEEEQILNKHKNIVKNYKDKKEYITQQIKDINKKIIYMQNKRDIIKEIMGACGMVAGITCDIITHKEIWRDLKAKLDKLDMEYCWSKYYLQEYIKENI